jgi:hypothetical protein
MTPHSVTTRNIIIIITTTFTAIRTSNLNTHFFKYISADENIKKGKAVPLYAMDALGGRGGIALTHSRPQH